MLILRGILRRSDRAVTVYTQRCKEAFKDVPVIIGGIEAVCAASPITIIGRIKYAVV